MWKARRLADKTEILRYLETDRLYAAYAIGDLEPGLFEQSDWAGAKEAGQLRSLVLHFRGLRPPALFLMGDCRGLRAILESELCPDEVYLTCRGRHLPMVRHFYAWEKMTPMWRMMLVNLGSPQRSGESCLRLASAHIDQLLALYALGGADAFSPAQVEQGVFHGVVSGGQLVAAAGTHLISRTYGVAAVGNIFTHPEHRGHGYGTTATCRVARELLQLGIRDIVLNVSQTNAGAIRIYQRLGFVRYCSFLEGPAFRRRGRGQVTERTATNDTSHLQDSTAGSTLSWHQDERGRH